jgi:hypothetical protein
MQILLARDATIIRISTHSIDNTLIKDYVIKNFDNIEYDKDTLFIPNAVLKKEHRLFLLKWLYQFYAKRNKVAVEGLKESLILRYKKPIKIVFLSSNKQQKSKRKSEHKTHKEKIHTNPLKARELFSLQECKDVKSIKKRYKELAKKYHPDLVTSNNTELKRYYTKKFQDLSYIYQTLLEKVS